MSLEVTREDFIHHYAQNPGLMMWFLGAGTSRSAGMPTATDIIWDLKLQYYCLHENIDIDSQDINNKSVKNRIQAYMDSKGYPTLWSAEEYSFYFELLFQSDYSKQQRYLNKVLATEKVSLNVGQRILAAMMGKGLTNIVFTTNFDEVIETAYSSVMRKNLNTFHIEGSYAALEALNSANFPIYAKIHGDFRYQSIKNLSNDLKSNDEKLKECLLAAATRYGLVVSGYSGRDENVMTLLREAIEQNNAFPRGLFWTVFDDKNVADSVKELLALAQSKGIEAGIVETGTFDETLNRLWKQIPGKDATVVKNVKPKVSESVAVPMPGPGNKFPILRTNALPIVAMPKTCGAVEYSEPLTYSDVRHKIFTNKANATITYIDQVLFWGANSEIKRVLCEEKVQGITSREFSISDIENSTYLKSHYGRALVRAVCQNKPLSLKQKGHTYFAFVSNQNNPVFRELRQVLGYQDKPGYVSGYVKGVADATWSEAISMQLDFKNGKAWLLLKPDIWISPKEKREEALEFLRMRRLKRYNMQQNKLLDAWITILFGDFGPKVVKASLYSGEEHSAEFEIFLQTAYSRLGG